MKDHLKVFLRDLRIETRWGELLAEIEPPEVPKYKKGMGKDDAAQADWIYQSGRRAEFERIMAFLNGNEESR